MQYIVSYELLTLSAKGFGLNDLPSYDHEEYQRVRRLTRYPPQLLFYGIYGLIDK
jgi:hypothetical protein